MVRRAAPRPPHRAFLDWVSRLVMVHRARLIRVARREGVGAEDALDCAQEAFEAFLVLPQARQLALADDDAGRLLAALTRNIARNRRRRHHVARPHEELGELAADATPVDEIIGQAEEWALTVGCLETLGHMQRAVVQLRLVDDAPGEAAAKLLGLPAGHVAVLLHRAKAGLRQCMRAAGHDVQR